MITTPNIKPQTKSGNSFIKRQQNKKDKNITEKATYKNFKI